MVHWVLVVVWLCHLSNAADCVQIGGPYDSYDECTTAQFSPLPTKETPIVGRGCKPLTGE
jgi:hypothetical protein